MSSIQIKIINQSSNRLPAYATPGSSGMDICADLTEQIEIKPLERVLIPTGIFVQIPYGYEIQVRPRSGLAIKQGITCLNSPGTIDSDYRGEIKIILINLSADNQLIQHGDRIAQLVVQKIEKAEWNEVARLEESVRNEGGFGHTGKN